MREKLTALLPQLEYGTDDHDSAYRALKFLDKECPRKAGSHTRMMMMTFDSLGRSEEERERAIANTVGVGINLARSVLSKYGLLEEKSPDSS